MKKAEAKIGGYYTARVSGRPVPIQIKAHYQEADYGWWAVNLVTGRTVRIYSATRLRMELTEAKAHELADSLRKIRREKP